ncbi:hypothetical protein N7532_006118 [Penicillium argentinense]|uniref:Ribosome recycling factor domain-containing protein n=1 Tax=Penicillium argentinense TaxID=1131581 RepID=A0A9W9FFA9_9EURO|nr:uncharacterized protein N7532_006118 [Penicillium argentinense]KAJ5099117.1 hypothetical protein N7532_006118 [Penicillium argentinense]
MLRHAVSRLSVRATSQCRPASWGSRPLLVSSRSLPVVHRNNFANSSILYKKKDKGKNATSDSELQGPATSPEDPFDLAQLQTGISTAVTRLKDDLSKLRAGGRFNTASLESLKVQLGKDSSDSFKLGDLAQVVPKGGRMVTLLAAEEEHIKPLASAIVSSNLSLTPQPDPYNPLQLNIPIPPPTKESRDQNVNVAKQAFEKAANTVRDARGVMHKRLQDMQKRRLRGLMMCARPMTKWKRPRTRGRKK